MKPIEVLQQWQAQSGGKPDLVFGAKWGGRLTNIKKSWGELLKDAGIENFRWHDLRHHFASKLVMASVDLNTVRELLGHSTITMTLRYAHLAPEHKANAVAKIAYGTSTKGKVIPFMNEIRQMAKRYLTSKEAAAYTGYSESFLRQARSDGPRKNRTPGHHTSSRSERSCTTSTTSTSGCSNTGGLGEPGRLFQFTGNFQQTGDKSAQ